MVKSKGPPYLKPPPEPHVFIHNAWGMDVTNNREFDLDEFVVPWIRALFEKDFRPFKDSENKNEDAIEVIFYRRNVRCFTLRAYDELQQRNEL